MVDVGDSKGASQESASDIVVVVAGTASMLKLKPLSRLLPIDRARN